MNILRKKYNLFPQSRSTQRSQNTSSFGLVEVVIGVSILSAGFGILFGVAFAAVRLASDATTRIQVSLLLEEGIEAMRMLRSVDSGWTTYYADTDADNVERCLLSSGNSYGVDTAATFADVEKESRWAFAQPVLAQGLQYSNPITATDIGAVIRSGAITSGYDPVRNSTTGAFQGVPNIYYANYVGNYYVGRVLLSFDTSAIPASATIVDATLTLQDYNFNPPFQFGVSVVGWSGGANGMADDDYSATVLNPTGSQIFGSTNSASAATVPIVLSGAAVTPGGQTYLMLRATDELSTTAPDSGYKYVGFSIAETPINKKPTLVVRYTNSVASGVPSNCLTSVGTSPFYRTVSIGPVCRDATTNNIISAGLGCRARPTDLPPNPLVDANTQRISVNVYWSQRGTIKKEALETYVTNR